VWASLRAGVRYSRGPVPAPSAPPERVVPRLRRSLTFLLPDGWSSEVVDLSATGLRLRCLAVLLQGTEVDGKLVLPDGNELKLKATVVWTSPPDLSIHMLGEIGLQLIEPPPEYHRALAELFASDE
jgi:hypothetical protein